MHQQRTPPARHADHAAPEHRAGVLGAPVRSWLRHRYVRRVLAYVNSVDGLRGRAEARRRAKRVPNTGRRRDD